MKKYILSEVFQTVAEQINIFNLSTIGSQYVSISSIINQKHSNYISFSETKTATKSSYIEIVNTREAKSLCISQTQWSVQKFYHKFENSQHKYFKRSRICIQAKIMNSNHSKSIHYRIP